MVRYILILSFVFAGCSPVLSCDRAALALWQDKAQTDRRYTATVRCYTADGHEDHHVLRSKTKITGALPLSRTATSTGDTP